MDWVDLAAGVVIVVGLVGVVLPVIPGVLLIAIAVVVWAAFTGGATAWIGAGIALSLLAVGFVVKFAVPHRQLREAGVPLSTILLGVILGIVGFFVIPVLGLFVGFIGGVWLAEARRLGSQQAWPSTRAALKATGLSILIELTSGLLAGVVFVGAALMT